MIRTGIILIIATVLACLSAMQAIGGISKKQNPALALAVWPKNGLAYEALAVDAFTAVVVEKAGQFPEDVDGAILDQARKSFLVEPTAAASVALLALSQDRDNRKKLMDLAQSLSKRELLSLTWSIYDSGERENVGELLTYYDRSMRTSRTSSTTLIPAIVSVIGHDGFAEPMADLLKRDPPWAGQFWKQAANNKAAVVHASKLRAMVNESDIDRSQLHDRDLVINLVRNNHFSEAEKLFSQTLAAKGQADQMTRIAPLDREPRLPPIDWQLYSSGKFFAFIDAENRILNLSLAAGASGVLARQLIRLKPGSYDLSLNVVAESLATDSLRVFLRCAEPDRADEIPLSAAIRSGANLNRFSVDGATCQYYWLSIVTGTGERVVGQDVAIDQIQLKPVNGSRS